MDPVGSGSIALSDQARSERKWLILHILKSVPLATEKNPIAVLNSWPIQDLRVLARGLDNGLEKSVKMKSAQIQVGQSGRYRV